MHIKQYSKMEGKIHEKKGPVRANVAKVDLK
jgi:hypothetical protein